jgi:hypothetical protein
MEENPMVDRPPYDIFISYSMKDRDWVAAFSDALGAAGVRSWFDVSKLAPGDRWQDRVAEALRDSKTLVLVLSSNSLSSPWTFFELGAAVADRKKIIPIVTDDVDLSRIPLPIRQLQFLREPSPIVAGKRVAETIGTSATNPH